MLARILLAEDEALIRLLLAEEFTDHGHEVVEASNAEDALRQVAGCGRCDVLVTDIHMGGEINGIELARRLRALDPGLPIVFMTGRPGAVADFGCMGPHGVLVNKPFTTFDIMCALESVIR